VASLMAEPFFRATTVGRSGYETAGNPLCAFGHKLEPTARDIPDGIFAEWSWDGSRLTVRNDRYGAYPIYYFTRPGEICVSTSIPELLAQGAPAELDERGLAAFLRLGFFIGVDTPFKAIRVVPPAASFAWRDGHLQVSGAYAKGKRQHLKRSEAVDAYISLFRAAIRRRPPPREDFAVPLSGGRDSRHILLELCAAGYQPKLCITIPPFPPVESDDPVVATALTEALGVRHVVLRQARSQLRAEIRKNFQTSFCSDEHAWAVAMVDYLRGRVTTAYDGLGGGMLSGNQSSLNVERAMLFDAGRLTDLGRTLLGRKEARLAKLLHANPYRRFDHDLAVEHLVAELQNHADAPNPWRSFLFWNKTLRENALVPYSMITHSAQVYSPYLDHDLYDFLTSLPANISLDLHTETIHQAYPRFANIPYGERRVSAGTYRHRARRLALELAWYACRQAPSPLVRTSTVLRWLLRGVLHGDYARMSEGVHPLVPHLLQLGSLVSGLPGASSSGAGADARLADSRTDG
jgi:asparagine synthase (glutamine-hydrolysing)